MQHPPEKRLMGLVKLKYYSDDDKEELPMQTEWRSSTVGTLVRLDGEPRQAGLDRENVIVDFFGVERFEVAQPRRDKFGFWEGDLTRITGRLRAVVMAHISWEAGEKRGVRCSTLTIRYNSSSFVLLRDTDASLPPEELRQAHLLAQGVQSLMWEYAKLVIQGNTLV